MDKGKRVETMSRYGGLGIFEQHLFDEYQREVKSMSFEDMLHECNLLEATFSKVKKVEFDNHMLRVFYAEFNRKLK